MSKKPETLFAKKVDDELKELLGGWWLNAQVIGTRGVPDRLGCVKGKFIALEYKSTETARVPPPQQLNIAWIKRAGGFATVVHPTNYEDVLESLVAYINETQ